MGCSDHIIPGYVNVDIRPLPGVDYVTDLSRPNLPDDITEIFSNAFFEHLHIADRVAHLRSIYKSLAPNGIINYMGIPWFPGIVEAYLKGYPGTMGNGPFDLYHAYRYTHGAPDEADDYVSQLHKGLFDYNEFQMCFEDAHIPQAAIYTYSYPGEPTEYQVTAGFFIKKCEKFDADIFEDEAHAYLSDWPRYANINTVQFQ